MISGSSRRKRDRSAFPPSSEPGPTPSPADASQTAEPSRAKRLIIVVDDEPQIRELVRFALEKSGYAVAVAADGAEALKTLRERADAALLVLDLNLPGMSARDLIRGVRALRPGLPVVISSGYDEAELAEYVPVEEVSAFVQKPFTVRSLPELIGRVLRSPLAGGRAHPL